MAKEVIITINNELTDLIPCSEIEHIINSIQCGIMVEGIFIMGKFFSAFYDHDINCDNNNEIVYINFELSK